MICGDFNIGFEELKEMQQNNQNGIRDILGQLRTHQLGPTQKHKIQQIKIKQLDHVITNVNIKTKTIQIAKHLSDHNIIII